METLFFECAIRAALLVAGAALILLALRVRDAAAQHKVWTGIVIVMLVLPVWTAWGPKASVRILPPLPEKASVAARATAVGSVPPDSSQLEMNIPAATVPTARPARWTWQTALLGLYLLGVAALLLRLATGVVRAQRLVRRATLHDGRLTSPSCAAPVTVGWFRPQVILPDDWPDWPRAKLDVVLIHEGEHARRRDPLIQGLSLVNRAVFWFHPAAWWLDRRLSALAEEACDDMVLSRGHNPSDYSEYLMDMARAATRAGTRVNVAGVAMPGSSLPRRIKKIVEGVPESPVSRTRMACVSVAYLITCAAFAAGSVDHALMGEPMRVPQQQASGVPVTGAELPKFETVSIRPHQAGDLNTQTRYSRDRFTAANISLRSLLRTAYQLRVAQGQVIVGLPDFADLLLDPLAPKWVPIIGAPNWIDSERFDIAAKMPGKTDAGQRRLMMQSLLRDRFNLAVRYETKVVPVYVLEASEAGRLGPYLRQHVTDGSCWDPAADQPSPSVTGMPTLSFCGGSRIVGPNNSIPENRRGVNMEGVAAYLTGRLDRPVLDRTGLGGSYDFDLVIEHTPTSDYSSLFAAVEQQLGLKLIPQNGPVDLFVIDHVERPSVSETAQAAPQQFVDTVIFDGNRRISNEELQFRIFTRAGDYYSDYSDEVLRRDLMALWNSNFFDDVRLEVRDSPDHTNGKIVIFHLSERQ